MKTLNSSCSIVLNSLEVGVLEEPVVQLASVASVMQEAARLVEVGTANWTAESSAHDFTGWRVSDGHVSKFGVVMAESLHSVSNL